MEYRDLEGRLIESKEGLLWVNGRVVNLPKADHLAWLHGFANAEQLVKNIANTRKEPVTDEDQSDLP